MLPASPLLVTVWVDWWAATSLRRPFSCSMEKTLTSLSILQQRGFFERVEPVNLFTVATPHAGLVRYPSMLSALATAIGSNLLSRTGEQFYCRDKWSQHGRPLLIVMADPGTLSPTQLTICLTFYLERLFYQTLTKFRNIKIYANA